MSTPPDFPIGPVNLDPPYDESLRKSLIAQIAAAPSELRKSLDGLDDSQLDLTYKNWTIRQIAHHLSDSHMHAFIRFKWALTETNPFIKGYDEAKFVELGDSRSGPVEGAVQLLEGLHQRWVQLLESMTQEDFEKSFYHPEFGESYDLWTTLNYYPWHSRHHIGQIMWLRENNGF